MFVSALRYQFAMLNAIRWNGAGLSGRCAMEGWQRVCVEAA